MRRDGQQKLRLISESYPDNFIIETISIFDIYRATEEFFDDNFRAAITLERDLCSEGFVNISADGFAFFYKVLLNAIFGESVVHIKMSSHGGVFETKANWKIYKGISKSDLSLLRSTAELSGFKMTLSEDGDVGCVTLSSPIKKTPQLAIYAISAAKMHEAFTRVFFF